MSLQDFGQHIKRLNPRAYDLFVSTTQSAFVAAAEGLIAEKTAEIESSRATYHPLPETALSEVLCGKLGNLVDAVNEAHTNGHVDLTLTHPTDRSWKYLVECKIWKGPAYHTAGMNQLLGYCTGRETRAMLLEFVKIPNMLTLLQNLQNHLTTLTPPVLSTPHSDIPDAFISTHTHNNGRPIGITHLGCDLSVPSSPP